MTQDTTPRVRAYFNITGDLLDIPRCTDLIGIEPMEAGNMGDRPGNRKRPLPWAIWSLCIDRRCFVLDEPLAELLGLIRPHSAGIARVLDQPGVRASIDCAVDLEEESISIELSAETVRGIADVGAGLSIDVADYRDTDLRGQSLGATLDE